MTLFDTPPARVAIVALGPSRNDYIVTADSAGDRRVRFDQVWAINTAAVVFAHDLVLHMDDVRTQEARAAAGNAKYGAWCEFLKRHDKPVLTSRPHPDYPCLEAYPLEQVINACGSDYFNNTVPYGIALAIAIGVKQLALFGCDYHWTGVSEVEPGRACVEFWLGRAMLQGVDVKVAPTSTLMDACGKRGPRYYGYDTLDVTAEVVDGKARIAMTPKDAAPDAAEIEQRYDHKPASVDAGRP